MSKSGRRFDLIWLQLTERDNSDIFIGLKLVGVAFLILAATGVDATVAVLANEHPPRLDVEPLEEAVTDRADESRDRERPEGGRGSEDAHEETSEETSGSFSYSEEEGAHQAHHAGDGVGRGNLCNVCDGCKIIFKYFKLVRFIWEKRWFHLFILCTIEGKLTNQNLF